MLPVLKFVQGAVARKSLVPEMTHFAIEDGRITSYNGMMALSSPIDCALNCNPKASVFIEAIAGAEGTVALSMTPAGRLRVVSGSMRVLVDCIERTLQPVGPDGTMLPLDETVGAALIKAFKSVEPFIGDDASRAWANGALLKGGSVYATCNVVLVQYWIGFMLPFPVNIPYAAIKEVLRIGEPPCAIQYTDSSITFHYSDGRWIRSQLFSAEWPGSIDAILDKPGDAKPIDATLFACIEKVKKFTDKSGRIVFRDWEVSTHDDKEEGAHNAIPMDITGIYGYDIFMSLKGIATHADFSTWPNPCIFFGENLRGVIIGRKQ